MRTTLLALTLITMVGHHLEAATLHVAADTTTNQKYPNENYGLWPTVTVRGGTEPRHGYVRFDLAPVADLAAGVEVERAVLRAYAVLVLGAGPIEIHPVLTPWQEGSLAWNAAPTLAPSVGAFAVASADKLGFVSADVTAVVREWLAGTLPNEGLALTPGATGVRVEFDSKENPLTSHPMELEVVLRSAGTPGPPGPPGPPGAVALAGRICPPGTSLRGFDTSLNLICTTPPPICGNGVLEQGEECDDGNTLPGDACSASCESQLTADIIVLADDSGSNAANLDPVLGRINSFVLRLIGLGVDTRLILIGDYGCVQAPLGSGTCPNDDNPPQFRRVHVDVGSQVFNPLVDRYGEYQADLRPGAARHVIAVTDGDSFVPHQVLQDRVAELPDPGLDGFRFHLLGNVADACGPQAVQYLGVVATTSGSAGDICGVPHSVDPFLESVVSSILGPAAAAP
jgi:cysteine-rich repeat protein